MCRNVCRTLSCIDHNTDMVYATYNMNENPVKVEKGSINVYRVKCMVANPLQITVPVGSALKSQL